MKPIGSLSEDSHGDPVRMAASKVSPFFSAVLDKVYLPCYNLYILIRFSD